jgi:hypothetical protein
VVAVAKIAVGEFYFFSGGFPPNVWCNPGGPATAIDQQLTERSIESDFFVAR